MALGDGRAQVGVMTHDLADGKYSLAEATQELGQAFTQSERDEFLAHLRGVVEAGDDA